MATKRKTKRFSDGGMSDEDVASFAGTPENESNAGMADVVETVSEKVKAKAKAPIVTKDQLSAFQKKFGADKTLRDYMNSQQGLTRRGTKAVDEVAAVAASRAADRKAEPVEAKPALKYQSLQDRAKSYADERAKSGVGMYGTKKSEPKEERMPYGRGPGLSVFKMAKGGSVNSASRRADGMASKGKTKGRMV